MHRLSQATPLRTGRLPQVAALAGLMNGPWWTGTLGKNPKKNANSETDSAQHDAQADLSKQDASELRKLLEAWPNLSLQIRRSIMAIVDTTLTDASG